MPRLWQEKPNRFPTLFPATRSRMPNYPSHDARPRAQMSRNRVSEISSLYLPHDLLRPCVPASRHEFCKRRSLSTTQSSFTPVPGRWELTVDSTPLDAALAGNSHCAKQSFRFKDAKTGMPRQENGNMPTSVFRLPRVKGLVLNSS